MIACQPASANAIIRDTTRCANSRCAADDPAIWYDARPGMSLLHAHPRGVERRAGAFAKCPLHGAAGGIQHKLGTGGTEHRQRI
jgi:hypothetical protein